MSFAERESRNSSQLGSILAFFGGEGFLRVCRCRRMSSKSSGDRSDEVGVGMTLRRILSRQRFL